MTRDPLTENRHFLVNIIFETPPSVGTLGEVEVLFNNAGRFVQLLLRDPSAVVCFYLSQLARRPLPVGEAIEQDYNAC